MSCLHLHSSRSCRQAKEQRPSVWPAPEIVEVAAVGQRDRAPPAAECCAQSLCCFATGCIGVEHAEDDLRTCEPAEAVQRKVGSTRAEGRQVPAHRGQPVEDALDEVHAPPPNGALEAQYGLIARWSEVLDPTRLTRAPADEPDGLAASDLGDDHATGETLPQRSAVFARLWSTQQPKVLRDT